MNVTCFSGVGKNATTSLSQARGIATSGAYDDDMAGVAIPPTTLAAGRYYIVPSTYTPGFEASFKLIVYCTISNFQMALVDSIRG